MPVGEAEPILPDDFMDAEIGPADGPADEPADGPADGPADEPADELTKVSELTKKAVKGPSSETDEVDEEIRLDDELFRKLRENISMNSLEIADLKSSNQSQISEDSNPITPRPRSGKKHPKFVYANILDEGLDESDEWTDLKRYRFQKCLWKLKYNRIVSSFYLDNLKKGETKWSWMIVVISTLTSGLTIANNVEGDDTPIQNYNTYINVLLTISSMSTSLIAAWIKKQMFIERINAIDKFLVDLNSLCEDLEVKLSLLDTNRLTDYFAFKEEYIPQMTKYLMTNPIIPPDEWKQCIREITMDYPELLNIDDTEDNKMWPWYGDLIYDINEDNKGDDDIPHARYPTSFYTRFRKSKQDRLRSSCCGKAKHKTVYNNN